MKRVNMDSYLWAVLYFFVFDACLKSALPTLWIVCLHNFQLVLMVAVLEGLGQQLQGMKRALQNPWGSPINFHIQGQWKSHGCGHLKFSWSCSLVTLKISQDADYARFYWVNVEYYMARTYLENPWKWLKF